MKYVVVDTETGGLDPSKHSVLQVAMLFIDSGEIKDTLNIYVKDEPLVITEGALKTNHIQINEEWLSKALTPNEAVTAIWKKCLNNYPSDGGTREGIFLFGQNTKFDIGFLETLWNKRGKQKKDVQLEFSHFFKRNYFDLISLTLMLQEMGLYPQGSVKLTTVAKHFGLLDGEQSHDAYGDAMLTFKVYEHLKGILTPKLLEAVGGA